MQPMKLARSLPFWLVAAATAHTLFFPRMADGQAPNKELVAKGQYIFAVAGGCACHTVPNEMPHAGARPFPIPLGTVYSTNITQDKETGLGAWTDQQILDAMIKGFRRDGSAANRPVSGVREVPRWKGRGWPSMPVLHPLEEP